jgi:hypothetical protein
LGIGGIGSGFGGDEGVKDRREERDFAFLRKCSIVVVIEGVKFL